MSSTIASELICWVPTCLNKYLPDKKYHHLPPNDAKEREIWLALATKRFKIEELDNIVFCDEHFERTSNQDITIDNNVHKSIEGKIPTKNMPAQICRMCNLIITNGILFNSVQFFTMSKYFSACVPTTILVELKYLMADSKSKTIEYLISYCFSEFNIPQDIIPTICKKCYYNLWLFYSFKKRALELENFLGQDLTPQKYGLLSLCRTCPEKCSNFFNLDKHTDMGTVLQTIFDQHYSPEVVPLRVCVNCYHILRKICEFRTTCILTNDMINKRDVLYEKFKSKSNIVFDYFPGENDQPNREQLYKKTERENMIFANIMVKYGNNLKQDIHSIENWDVVCAKLKEHDINYKIPNLIKNWKHLQKVTEEKIQSNIPLSEIEKLVNQFYQTDQKTPENPQLEEEKNTSLINKDLNNTSNIPDLTPIASCSTSFEVANVNEITTNKSEPNTEESESSTIQNKIELFHLIMKHKNAAEVRNEANFLDLSPELIQIIRDNGWNQPIELINETWYEMANTQMVKENKQSKLNNPTDNTLDQDEDFPPELTPEETIDTVQIHTTVTNINERVLNPKEKKRLDDKLALANAMRLEFDKCTIKEKKNRGLWRMLVSRVVSNHLKGQTYTKVLNLWNQIRRSAKIHEPDGRDPVDVIVSELLNAVKIEKEKNFGESSNKFAPTLSVAIQQPSSEVLDDGKNVQSPEKNKTNPIDEPMDNVIKPYNVSDTSITEEDEITASLKKKSPEGKKRPHELDPEYKPYKKIKPYYLCKDKDQKNSEESSNKVAPTLSVAIQQPSSEVLDDGKNVQSPEKNKTNPIDEPMDNVIKPSNVSDTSITEEDEITASLKKKSPEGKKRPHELDPEYKPYKIMKPQENNDAKSKAVWSDQEKEILISAVTENLLHSNNKLQWEKIYQKCNSNGCFRSLDAIKQHWKQMLRTVNTKLAENVVLNRIDKKVKQVINQENFEEPKVLEEVTEQVTEIKEEIPYDVSKDTDIEIECIDLTYDYVSLDNGDPWNTDSETDIKPKINLPTEITDIIEIDDDPCDNEEDTSKDK